MEEMQKESVEKSPGFIRMVIDDKKFKDFFMTIEGILSLIGGIIVGIFFFHYSADTQVNEFNKILSELAVVFIAGLLGLLGIIFAGLTFASGSISLKATENIYKEEKIKSLLGIFFSFYFVGWLIALTIVLYVIVYFLGLSPFAVNPKWTGILAFFIGYLTIFLIFYTVGLFDTCINLFFVNYKFNQKDEQDKR